jgi:hypothetical protein
MSGQKSVRELIPPMCIILRVRFPPATTPSSPTYSTHKTSESDSRHSHPCKPPSVQSPRRQSCCCSRHRSTCTLRQLASLKKSSVREHTVAITKLIQAQTAHVVYKPRVSSNYTTSNREAYSGPCTPSCQLGRSSSRHRPSCNSSRSTSSKTTRTVG